MRPPVLLVLIAAAASEVQAEDRPTLAILPPGGNAAAEEIDLVDDAIRDAMVSSRKFRVQDRAAMREVLAAQQFNSSEVCDESCAVEQGRILQVAKLATAQVKRAGADFWISLRLTSVETGEVEKSAMRACKGCGTSELVDLAQILSRELLDLAPLPLAPLAPAPAPLPPREPPPPAMKPDDPLVRESYRWSRPVVGLGVPLVGYEWGGEHWSFILGWVAIAARYYQDPMGDGWLFTLGAPPGVAYQWMTQEGRYIRLGYPQLVELSW